jgi:hypothetical protein
MDASGGCLPVIWRPSDMVSRCSVWTSCLRCARITSLLMGPNRKYHSVNILLSFTLYWKIIHIGKIYEKDTFNSYVKWSEAGYPYRQNPCALAQACVTCIFLPELDTEQCARVCYMHIFTRIRHGRGIPLDTAFVQLCAHSPPKSRYLFPPQPQQGFTARTNTTNDSTNDPCTNFGIICETRRARHPNPRGLIRTSSPKHDPFLKIPFAKSFITTTDSLKMTLALLLWDKSFI